MMTATEAYKTLGISRNTFYLRVKDLGIELVKSGRNSMIQAGDLQRIKEALGTKRQNVSSVLGRHTRTSETGQVGHADDNRQEVIDELRSQNTFLKGQVESEKVTNTKLLEQMNQSQQLMLAMQTETMRLRSENQKLLLEHQPPLQTAEQSKDIKNTIEEVDPVTAETKSRSSRMGWFALTIAMITALGWFVLQQAPGVQMRLTDLVR
jgi:transcriptional regulator of acetoin/glycerol metabolism|tara:strand:- start:2543 stop:3166 length:624 start_codon:yes stop_codon:yes gene_type:complete